MGRGGGGVEGESCDDDHHLLRISEDVLIQILLWLPVISLLRFKSVCKSWRSIIESPFFIHHLYHHATATATATTEDSSSVIFVGGNADMFNEGKIFKVSGVKFDVLEDLGRPPLLDLGEQIACVKEWWSFSVEGCCNGIICLHDYLTRNIALWNPATKQSRVVPKPSNALGDPNYFEVSTEQHCYWAEDFVRFGIDIKTNDYKLLLITSISPIRGFTTNDPPIESIAGERRRVHVYNLSTDSWRCIDAHPYPDDIRIESDQGLYLNGSYFFKASYFNEEGDILPLFLSFDFTGEIFRTIQPPPLDLRRDIYSRYGYPYFIYFGGEKVALVDPKKKEEEVEYDIWVLNEQQHGGVKEESWTKFYTIASSPDRLPSEPHCITNNGEFAIGWYSSEKDREQKVQKLELLNFSTGEKKILWCGYDSMRMVHVYKPSLVPTGGDGATHNSRLLELDGTP